MLILWNDIVKFLRNVQDCLTDGKTLYERRFGEPFTRPILPLETIQPLKSTGRPVWDRFLSSICVE